MRKLLSVLSLAVLLGCATGTQFKTIAAAEQAVLTANSAYLDRVVTGQAKTNDVPQVEAAFNDTQMVLHTAAALASGGASSPPPAAASAKATLFINSVNAK